MTGRIYSFGYFSYLSLGFSQIHWIICYDSGEMTGRIYSFGYFFYLTLRFSQFHWIFCYGAGEITKRISRLDISSLFGIYPNSLNFLLGLG